MAFELIDPPGLESPVGYAHVAKITGGTIVHVAGQAPFNERGEVVFEHGAGVMPPDTPPVELAGSTE